MKKLTLLAIALLLVSFSFAHNEDVAHYVDLSDQEELVNPDGFFEYMIVKGDWLSTLADKFYGNPLKWTKIHKANPYIIDPNWIYPNNWLVIPNVFADEYGNPMKAGEVKTWADEDGTLGDTSKTWGGATLLDLDGDGIVDGVDLDGDGVADDAANIDLDGDGKIDGYDLDGDGEIDIKSSAALAAAQGIDLDGDGVIDGVDIDGDGNIDADAGLDIDNDGVVDGYDVDGDGKIDVAAGAAAAAGTVAAATIDDDEKKKICDGKDCKCKHSYCGKPGWKLGLHAGYPLGSAPEDESLNFGLLLGTPLGVKVGPLNIGLGAGAFTYNYEDLYVGGGVLASLCINELLKVDMPLKLQLHGAGFYVFGEESGPGFGALGSGTLPLGNSPLSLGVYGGAGKYYPGEDDFNWVNVGAVLFYNF